MLDTMTQEQFNERVAYKQLEPDKLDRLRVIVTRGFQCLCNSWGSKIAEKDLDPDFVEEPQEVTPDQLAALMKARY